MLHMINLDTKSATKKDSISHATFVNDKVVALTHQGGTLLVLDPENVSEVEAEHQLEIEEPKSIMYTGENSLFVFYDECFNLNIYDFERNITEENLKEFEFAKVTKFEEIFTPSDNVIEDELDVYWLSKIGSFSESADVIYKSEENKWALAAPEEQSIRILAPSDSSSCICSFKGIVDYPFKFTQGEKDTCLYKFTEEEIEIGSPRRIITLSYTGRLDIYEVYFKDIPTDAKKEPKEILSQRQELPEEEKKQEPAQPKEEQKQDPVKPALSGFTGSEKPAFLTQKKVEPLEKKSVFGDQSNKPSTSPFGTQSNKPSTSLFGTQSSKPSTSPFGTQSSKPSTGLFGTQSSKPPATPFGTPSLEQKDEKPSTNGSLQHSIDKPSSGFDSLFTDQKEEKKQEEPVAQKPKASLGEKTSEDKAIDQKKENEAKEQKFIESIQDPFQKVMIRTQYSLANDINSAFEDLHTIKFDDNFTSKEAGSEIMNFQKETDKLTTNIYQQKGKLAEIADKLAKYYEMKEKICHYWSSVKDSDKQTHQETRDKLRDNDLFTEHINETIAKGDKILVQAASFVNVIRRLSLQSRGLDSKVNSQRKLNISGAPNDPFLKDYSNSGVIGRIIKDQMNSDINAKRPTQKTRRQAARTKERLNQVQSDYIDDLIRTNEKLFRALDENFDRLSKKFENYGLVYQIYDNRNGAEGKSDFKIDFRNEVRYLNVDSTRRDEYSLFKHSLSTGSSTKHGGLIELQSTDLLQQQLENSIQEERKERITVVQHQTSHDSHLVEGEEQGEGDDSDDVAEPKSVTEKRASPTARRAQQKKEETKTGGQVHAVTQIAQNDMSFGHSSQEDADESNDEIGDLSGTGKVKPLLRKQKTSVPDNLKLTCKPSELLDDFFTDPNEKQLPKLDVGVGKFTKHRSEAVKPVSDLRRRPNAFDLMKEKNKHKDLSTIVEREESKQTIMSIIGDDKKDKEALQNAPSKMKKFQQSSSDDESSGDEPLTGLGVKKSSIAPDRRPNAKASGQVHAVTQIVQDQMYSEEFSEEDDEEEYDDEIGDLSGSGKVKPLLRKQKTSVPEDLKLTCKPSELLDDFFNDPNEKPLPKLDVGVGKFTKHRSEAAKPITGLRRRPNAFDLMKEKNKHKDDKPEIERDDSKKALKSLICNDKTDGSTFQNVAEKAEKNQEDADNDDLVSPDNEPKEEKKEVPVSKEASKTFYGVNPMEMARKFDQEKTKEKEGVVKKEETGDDMNDDDVPKPDFKVEQPKKSNPFQSSGIKPTGFGGFNTGATALKPAAFGQSSFTTAPKVEPQSKQGLFGAERKFGSIIADKDNSQSSSGFKGLFTSSQPTTNTFLASGANANDDNDMAADEDIFGTSSQPQPTGFGIGIGSRSSPFASASTGFGGSSQAFGTQVNTKSNPSFTQRRK